MASQASLAIRTNVDAADITMDVVRDEFRFKTSYKVLSSK